MCRRQFLQQQSSSSQTAEELARAEVSAQAVLSQVREVGQFMRRRGELRITGPGDILEAHLHNIFTRNDSVEDDGDEPSINSAMYS